MSIRMLTIKKCLLMVLLCCLLSLFWTIVPLFGWSYYTLEPAQNSCSVEWNNKSFNVVSYNLCIFLCVFFIPIIIMLICHAYLIKKVITIALLISLMNRIVNFNLSIFRPEDLAILNQFAFAIQKNQQAILRSKKSDNNSCYTNK